MLATHLLSKKFPDSNVVFSPLSIHVALSLLANGSKGPTLDQLLAFLKTNTTDELNSLYSELVSLILADGSPSGGPLLSFANGVWVEKTLALKPSFKQVVDTVYKAACNQVDFRNKAVKVVKKVNLWADKQTNGLIKRVLRTNAINNDTRLIFANAIYFKGVWSHKFKKSWTRESDFHLPDGRKVRVPFMTDNERQFVKAYDDFKVLGLRYLKGEDKRAFTMYFFLPDARDGLQSLVEKIGSTPDFFDRHIPHQKVQVGKLLIPKFKISSWFKASDVLKELGLVLPFEDVEDFTKLVDLPFGERLHVSSIHHKSFVEVDEEGTKAAAVSAALICLGCPRRTITEKVDFVADHPFLFVIREEETRVVLFIGQVTNPRAS
ncbi:hypothetical protein SSX86_001937 [Deinandra increscens subsp. villosa]|uniref:Serpin domain-containing protein n=1 Tax=Deinandra increscens subsp. villosa TaxID=3103831 RepID=A0AAP0DSD6_9ASTR